MKLWERAHKLLAFAMENGSAQAIRDGRAKWLIHQNQGNRLFAESPPFAAVGRSGALVTTLFDIPIDWTVEDPPDTAEIRLSIGPLIGPRVFMDDPLKDILQE